MAPREKPLVQPAARWLLRQRPLEPELVDSFCHNADVLHFIVTRTERDHVTRSRGGTLIVLSEEDGRMLSLWWWRGTWALSRCELVTGHINPLPHCFFPHRSLGGRKWEGARDGVALWKESYPWAQRGKTETLAMRVVSPAERSVSMGFRQAWHTLSVSVISMQGRPLRLTMTVRHLQQRR